MYHQCYQKNVKFILKESSKLAWAYVRSDFLKKSLDVAKSFKLVSDVTRLNEEGSDDNKWNAGPIFIKNFREYIQNYPKKNKIETLVFCGDL